MNVKIIVATHKVYRMPTDDVYFPIHAGRLGKNDIGYAGDDTGDNISDRNWYYSEVSAIYWAWKNLKADAVGVAHYRRHYTVASRFEQFRRGKWNCILTGNQAKELLKHNDIIVSKRRWYLIETNRSHYSNGHNPKELDLMRKIMQERCPEYVAAFDEMNGRRWAHMFNMFIMKRDKFDAFCEWWYDILFEFEKRIDMGGYPEKEKRAYIDERMLDVWLIKNQYPYKEIPVMYMEKQNWIKKIGIFFIRKFFIHHNI